MFLDNPLGKRDPKFADECWLPSGGTDQATPDAMQLGLALCGRTDWLRPPATRHHRHRHLSQHIL